MTQQASLRSIISSARTLVRRDATIATMTATATAIPALLLLAWLMSLTTSMSHTLPLILDLLALVLAVALALILSKKWINTVTDQSVAASAEAQHGFAEGELQNVLEMSDTAPAGTSGALLRRAERNLAMRLGETAPNALAGNIGARTRHRRLRALSAAGALTALVAILAFAAPERSRASWAPLLKPVATIAATALPPLEVSPGNVSVARGSDVAVQVGAHERAAVVLYWRARGDVLHEETIPVLDARASSRIANIDAVVKYWVKAPDGAVSDTFTVTPIDPLMVSALSVEVVYPAYLRRETERFEKDVPPLELPQGTELRIRGRSTRTLSDITLVGPTERVPLQVAGSTFTATWQPHESGVYNWQLGSNEAADATPSPLDIKIIADMPPELSVTYPGVDTLLPGDMKQLLVAEASDDHAVISASVVSWRTSATGERDPQQEQPLSLEGDVDRKLLRGVLDATSRRLLPGDTLNYFVRVTDNSPSRQTTTSRIYTLRVPSMEEMRDRAQQEADDLVKDADAVAKSMQQLENRTRELQRKSVTSGAKSGDKGNGGAPGSNPQRQLGSEQAAQAKEVLQRQQEMSDQLNKLKDRIEAMQRAAEQAGLQDPELQKRMNELRELYDQLLTPEMKKQMEELQKALENLDPEQVQKALEQLAKQQEEMRAKLDQSLDLMRRAAAEQEMTKLSQEARELATQQDALAEDMKTNPKDAAGKQKQIEKKTDELSDALARLQRKLSEQGESDASSKTGTAQEQTKDAQDAMSQASKAASQNQSGKAGQSGEQAAGKLDEAAKTLDAARKQMTDAWKKETQQSVDNATQDAINLAEMQKQLLDKMKAQKQLGNSGQQQQQQGGGQQQQPGQQPGQQQDGKQNAGSKDKGQQQGGKAGDKGEGQKQGGQQGSNGASGQPGANPGNMQQMRSDQAAVKQGLEQLGKNLQEAGQRSAMVNREVGSALARANLNVEETMKGMEQASGGGSMPQEQAEEALDALNRLALELLKNGQQIQQSESGTGLQQALQQLAELAKQQGNLNGRSSSLMPLNLGPKSMSQQLSALAREQQQIAEKLGGMNKGGARDDLLGRLDDLVKEADEIAKDLAGGRIAPQTLQRQQELFHKLLDAGKTMERDEVSEERKAEAAQPLPASVIRALRPGLFDNSDKYAAPTAEQLKDMPPAYRKLILEYFQKLNASEAKTAEPKK